MTIVFGSNFVWSTGPGLNRRILVLQTSALATSPPVLSACLRKNRRHATDRATLTAESSGSRRVLLRLRCRAQVRLHRLVAPGDLVGLVIRNSTGDDHVITLFPVCRRGDAVLRSQLHGVEHA